MRRVETCPSQLKEREQFPPSVINSSCLCVQVGLQRDRLPHHGLVRPLVVLLLLLLPSALLHLPDSGVHTGIGRHHGLSV